MKPLQYSVAVCLKLSVVTLLSFAVAACSDDIVVGRAGPNDAQALAAIQRMIAQGARLLAVPLPSGVSLTSARVHQCVLASPQAGYRCSVAIATPDLPLIGGFAADVTLRFVKTSAGEWNSFLN